MYSCRPAEGCPDDGSVSVPHVTPLALKGLWDQVGKRDAPGAERQTCDWGGELWCFEDAESSAETGGGRRWT